MKKNIKLAKALRKNPTESEQLLWKHLRMKQLEGVKFRRQEPIDNYIVDFISLEHRLVIEIDGSQHAESKADLQRDEYLKREGFKVLRFWNNEVLNNIEGVIETVFNELKEHPSPLIPSRKGRGS